MNSRFVLALVVGLLGGVLSHAAVYNMDGFHPKTTGDAFSALEVNAIVDTIRGIDRDDLNTSTEADDRYGIGLDAGFAPTEKLDVNGNVKANAFIGDGSLLTNVATTSFWTQTGADINYPTGSVGIGTAYPDETLTVIGNVKAANFFYSDGTPVSGGGGGYWSGAGSNIYRSTGYVGIGMTNPTQALDVDGVFRGRQVVGAGDPWDGSGVQLGGNVLGWADQGGTNGPDSVNGAPDLWLTANNQVYVRSPGGLNVNQKVSSPSYCDENGLNCFGTPRIDLYKINTQTLGLTDTAETACQALGYHGFWAGMNQSGNEDILCYVISGIPVYRNY